MQVLWKGRGTQELGAGRGSRHSTRLETRSGTGSFRVRLAACSLLTITLARDISGEIQTKILCVCVCARVHVFTLK